MQYFIASIGAGTAMQHRTPCCVGEIDGKVELQSISDSSFVHMKAVVAAPKASV